MGCGEHADSFHECILQNSSEMKHFRRRSYAASDVLNTKTVQSGFDTTPPGTLTAHERFYLVLLCSQPDTVRRFPLRKTKLRHCIEGPTMYGFYSVSFLCHFVKGLFVLVAM